MILCISRIAVMCFKKKEKKRKRYVCTISGLLHSHSQHLINNFDSFVLFFLFHDSIYRISKIVVKKKKEKKNKKVCLYNVSAYYICIHSSIVSILFIHLLSTVKKKKKEKKTSGSGGTLSDSLGA